MATRSVSYHDLKNGDMISHYGATLRLSNRVDHGVDTAAGHTEEIHGAVITFDVELVGDEYGNFPRHWLDSSNPQERYHLQGNRRAHASLIVEE